MKTCPQTPTQSVWDHGVSVSNYFQDLYKHLKFGRKLKLQWRLPDWVYENKETILNGLARLSTITTYQLYHDCGKPYCREVDKQGRQHFPNHASVSASVWRKISDDEEVANLIAHDMDIHLVKAADCEAFAQTENAITLLLTGLCEIHSNASMFGGIESTSFKIKWKQLNKRGKRILSFLVAKPLLDGVRS